MTDITELAQRNELLIANGQQTADLLRHLADNEIDSDYFAVVSECESYGKETDAELSITEFALRAAGYVDALVEALEKAQTERDEFRRRFNLERSILEDADKDLKELRQRIAELENYAEAESVGADKTAEDVLYWMNRCKELESRTVKLPKPISVLHRREFTEAHCAIYAYPEAEVNAALDDAGIKVEAE